MELYVLITLRARKRFRYLSPFSMYLYSEMNFPGLFTKFQSESVVPKIKFVHLLRHFVIFYNFSNVRKSEFSLIIKLQMV